MRTECNNYLINNYHNIPSLVKKATTNCLACCMHYLGCEKDFLAEPSTGDQIFTVQLPVHGMFRFCVPMHNEPTSISNERYYNLIRRTTHDIAAQLLYSVLTRPFLQRVKGQVLTRLMVTLLVFKKLGYVHSATPYLLRNFYLTRIECNIDKTVLTTLENH